jgi:hypothetical protein
LPHAIRSPFNLLGVYVLDELQRPRARHLVGRGLRDRDRQFKFTPKKPY